MWVVKLGGSLACSEDLQGWLRVLAGDSSLVIVPGGGPFADQVRRMQNQWGFDESTAHQMALLAMEQFGTMFCALQPGLTAAVSVEEIDDVQQQRGETPVWMPSLMVMPEPDIAHSWEVTSDALSLWLSERLGADALVLVKSISLTGINPDVERLVEGGVIDVEFSLYFQSNGIPAWLMSASDHAHFGALRNGEMVTASMIT
ncbi:MAG: amino acid kinase [Candidatus Thiodiazotropha sp. (ex Ustalcina ferruginea)]|nr:amino acid kinase [Candidatus Thiodiazotropha sp. (ex Ustalcina ferruginea)]